MSKETLKRFVCDICKKKCKIIAEGGGFPYHSGWVYLYNFSFKMIDNDDSSLKDSHFCSEKCMLKALEKAISEESERVKEFRRKLSKCRESLA